MRLLLLLICFLVVSPAQKPHSFTVPADDLNRRLMDFNSKYVPLLKKIWHCPDVLDDISQCHPEVGAIDYKLWQEAAAASRRLFGEDCGK